MRTRRPIRDYYKILGLDESASHEDIRESYRRMAKKYHPDVSKSEDAEFWMRLINEAYDVLSDPRKRAFYDFIYFADYHPYSQASPEYFEVDNFLPMSRMAKFRSIFSNLVINIVGLKGQLDFVLVSLVLFVAALYVLFQQAELAAGLMAVLLIFGAIILMIRIFAELLGRAGIRFEEPWLHRLLIDRNDSQSQNQ